MIEVEGLSKYYRGRPAIEGVSFQIQRGEIVGLLGLNGAGKSTILKILGCFLTPSAGKAKVAGLAVEEKPEQVRKLIGYLPDRPPLYDEMSVYSYLAYVAKLKGVASSQVAEMVAQAISKTNLEDVSHSLLGELSHGYRQRVGIAQAIVHRPEVLILDEPINGLDPVQIVEMRDLITSLRGDHTVILSSHILSEITYTCDRVLIVDKGRLIAEGNEADLSSGLIPKQIISCQVRLLPSQLIAEIQSWADVESCTIQDQGDQVQRITITSLKDLRPELARCLVNGGAELLELQRQEGGLESVFMRLTQTPAAMQEERR